MGTSTPSTGSPGNCPLLPPWADPQPETAPSEGDGVEPVQPEAGDSPPVDSQVSVDSRFSGARAALGRFSSSGSNADLKSALSSYVNKGYSGRANTTRRYAGTSSSASNLNAALFGLSTGEAYTNSEGISLSNQSFDGLSANESINLIIRTICPTDGSQDTEAHQHAMANALCAVYDEFPDADLLKLSDEEREVVIETFVAEDVMHRFYLDCGKHFFEKCTSASTAFQRDKEVESYIKEVVNAAFEKLRNAGQTIHMDAVKAVVDDAISDVVAVFGAG